MLDRSFTATNRAISTPPRAAAPLPMPPLAFQPPAHQGRGAGALAMLDQIQARDAALRRDIIDWDLEKPDQDVNDDEPWYDLEPNDPSYSSAMPPEDEEDEEKQNGEEDDEEENPPEEAALRVRQNGDDEEDDEEKDIDITVIDVDEEHELVDEYRALPSIVDLDDDIEPGETPPYDPQVPQGADPAVP